MPPCTLKKSLVAGIVPPVQTVQEKICCQCNSTLSDGGQNPQSSFCVKLYSKIQLKLMWGVSCLSETTQVGIFHYSVAVFLSVNPGQCFLAELWQSNSDTNRDFQTTNYTDYNFDLCNPYCWSLIITSAEYIHPTRSVDLSPITKFSLWRDLFTACVDRRTITETNDTLNIHVTMWVLFYGRLLSCKVSACYKRSSF